MAKNSIFIRMIVAQLLVFLMCTESFSQVAILEESFEKKIIKVANEYVKKTMPDQISYLDEEAVVLDDTNHWIVVYRKRIKDNVETIGGGPNLYLDKQTFKVVKVKVDGVIVPAIPHK